MKESRGHFCKFDLLGFATELGRLVVVMVGMVVMVVEVVVMVAMVVVEVVVMVVRHLYNF